MLKILLKHIIYEICIETFFNNVFNNFVKPKVKEYLRRFKSTWTLADAEKMAHFHGVDIEKELMDALTREIQEEEDRTFLYSTKDQVKEARRRERFNESFPNGWNHDAQKIVEEIL